MGSVANFGSAQINNMRKQYGSCPRCNKRMALDSNGRIPEHVKSGTRKPCEGELVYPKTEWRRIFSR